MNRYLTYLSATLLTLCALSVHGQVSRTIIVEHFTNTRCGICAFNNPPFFTNLVNQGDALHIAYHPSAPYSTCLLNNHNVAGNDDRTVYYNTYGSTPDFFFQGVFTLGAGDASKFDPYEGQMSPASIDIIQTNTEAQDSIHFRVVVRTEASHSLPMQRLYVAVVEDTVFYMAPNGEDEHFNVFRTALTAAEGNPVMLPATVGDSLVLTGSVAKHPDWDYDRMYAVAILQDEATKAVEQSAKTTEFRIQGDMTDTTGMDTTGMDTTTTGIFEFAGPITAMYPNPVSDQLQLVHPDGAEKQVLITDLAGREVYATRMFGSVSVSVADFPKGIYLIRVEGEPVQKLIVE